MMRRSFFFLAAAAAAASSPTAPAVNAKMSTLHKLLTGEVHFKGKLPVKECNIVHQFGEGWEAELLEYAKSVPAEQRKVLERQLARVRLTKYTIAELALYAGEGPAHLDTLAREGNIKQAVTFLKEKGPEEFERYVAQEAVNANWKPEEVKKFIEAVKAKSK